MTGRSARRRRLPVGVLAPASASSSSSARRAAGAAEPRHVPGVDDAHRGGRKEHQAVVGHAARQEPGLLAVEHDAPAHEPGAVLAAARKRPAAGYPIAAVDHRRLTKRCEGAAAHDLRVAAVDLPRGLLGEVGARHAARGADHCRPAGGTVGRRDGLDGLDHGRRVDLAPAERARHAHTEDAAGGERVHQPGREPALALGLGGRRPDARLPPRAPEQHPRGSRRRFRARPPSPFGSARQSG